MSQRVNALLLMGFALALSILGASLLVRELAPFRFSFGTQAALVARLAVERPPVPPSIRGADITMEECVMALSSLQVRLGPLSRTQAVAGNCAAAALEATEAMPSYAYGHYVLALARFVGGEPEAAVAALSTSQAVGAKEQWVAELRVALAEGYYDRLDPAYAEGPHLADLALLAQSQRGIRSIATRYVQDPAFRERVTAVVETLPPEVQSRFVSLVRSGARAQGAGV